MSTVTKVLYKTCDDYSINDAAKYYFYSNLLGLSENIDNQFEKYYEKEIKVKNTAIGEDGTNISSSTSILAISSIKNKSVVIANV